MRIQLSLTINDPQVYERCSHLKEAKELNPLVVRLLTAYMNDEEGIFESVSEGIDDAPPEQKDYSTEYDSIRESLAILDIMTQDAGNLFSDSKSTFEDYMDTAVASGIVKEKETDTGDSTIVPNLDLFAKKPKNSDKEEKTSDMFDFEFVKDMLIKLNKSMSTVQSDVKNLKKYVNYPGGTNAEESTQGVSDEDVTMPDAEVSMTAEPEMSTEAPEFSFEDNEDDGIEFQTEEPALEPEPEPSTPKSVDARSAIGDLLGSLL